MCVVWISRPYSNSLFSFWLILDLGMVTSQSEGTGEGLIDYYSHPVSAPTALHFVAHLVEAAVGHRSKMK